MRIKLFWTIFIVINILFVVLVVRPQNIDFVLTSQGHDQNYEAQQEMMGYTIKLTNTIPDCDTVANGRVLVTSGAPLRSLKYDVLWPISKYEIDLPKRNGKLMSCLPVVEAELGEPNQLTNYYITSVDLSFFIIAAENQ